MVLRKTSSERRAAVSHEEVEIMRVVLMIMPSINLRVPA